MVIDRATSILDRLGLPGTGLVGPLLGRRILPISGVALDVDHRRLLAWHLSPGGDVVDRAGGRT